MPIFPEVSSLGRQMTKVFFEEDFMYCAQNMINGKFLCLIEIIQSDFVAGIVELSKMQKGMESKENNLSKEVVVEFNLLINFSGNYIKKI